ncbi:MAG TPA: signal recognition particle-docking protein FtsY [Nitrosopumilaceae archaeon]|nr:signal recognition particle-docking protein FtsY [Nitrosopumilaceae archaeon]
MFENLRSAFSNVAKSLSEKELKEKDIDEVLSQLEISLLESDVATEVIDGIKDDLKKKLLGAKVDKHQVESFVKNSLVQSISSLFDAAGTIDILAKISAKKQTQTPYIILCVGINGTGKTTTLAKFAYFLQQAKFSVVVAAADTYRAGAIEQLKEHTKRLNLKIVAQNYGSDPAAVAKDAVLHAQSNKIDCILVDTAGRMQTSKNLMDQIAKITKVVNPDLKLFVGDSLAGNDTVSQAREFYQHTKFDGAILTKSDADARGGAALSIVKITNTPILYLGVGQEYKDLKPFDKQVFLETVFGKSESAIKTETKYQEPQGVETEPVKEQVEEKPIPQIKQESKQAPKEPEPKSKERQKVEQEVFESSDDPFEGIDTKQINQYVEQFDAPPPENDTQAKELAAKIKKWISQGQPKPGQETKISDSETRDDSPKPKKKRSFFGKLRK